MSFSADQAERWGRAATKLRLFELLEFQRVVYMIFSAVYVFNGSLSRVSIDDKGTCVKVTFGLPPLYHPDDPARAVRCALLIRDEIRPMRSWSGGGLKANIDNSHDSQGL